MSDRIAFTLNGAAVGLAPAAADTLLQALRDVFALKGPRFGCGLGQCGACNVLVDGRAVAACFEPIEVVAGREVITLEGLGTADAPHPLQRAFIDEQAMQCGYCVSGVIASAAALLARDPDPDEAAVRAALDGNLCRCGAHNRMVRAVLRAAVEMRERADG
jgi:nicotinate dehydrogenase subunit A